MPTQMDWPVIFGTFGDGGTWHYARLESCGSQMPIGKGSRSCSKSWWQVEGK